MTVVASQAEPDTAPLLSVCGLGASFGLFRVLSGINLSVRNAGLAARSSAQPPTPRRGPRRSVAAIAAAACIAAVATLATAATAAAAPAPAPGVAPGAVFVSPAENDVVYTAGNRTVWVKNLDSGSVARVSNGLLASAPSAIYNGVTVIVFGEGTDHRLWWTLRQPAGSYAPWTTLGGAITAQPGAVFTPVTGDPSEYSVFVRGTDGAVYELDHSAGGWSHSFTKIGGRLLAGTGPAAAWTTTPASPSSITYLLVVGTNRALYLAALGLFGFSFSGGQTTASPGLAAFDTSGGRGPTVVAFARGTDNQAYWNQLVIGTSGWKPLGGRLTSGLVATTDPLSGSTYVYTLGTDGQVYQRTTDLNTLPLSFSPGWRKVTG